MNEQSSQPHSRRLSFIQAAHLSHAVLSLKRKASGAPSIQESAWNVFQGQGDFAGEGKPLVAEPDHIDSDDAPDSSDEADLHLDDEHEYRPPAKPQLRALYDKLQLTSVQKNVLKCAIAYTLASLFTFVRPLSDAITVPFDTDGKPVGNAHFIATVATYYNPARTMGSMTEANLFMVWAALFSVFVAFGSMTTAVALNNDDLEWLSRAIAVVFWLGGSCGFVAYMKSSVNRPTFGSACSMTVLINSIIICREGAIHLGVFETSTILQTLLLAVIGTLISNVVCLTIWRGSAVLLLQENINKTLDSFATLITLLSKTFMLEEDYTTSEAKLKEAIKAHEAAFSGLKSQLQDAKLELFQPRIQRNHEIYDEAVRSMTRLAQHLTGLRSGCRLQRKLLQSRKEARMSAHASDASQSKSTLRPSNASSRSDRSEVQADYSEEYKIFAAFEEIIGDTLERVAKLCRQSCKMMRTSFTHSRATLFQAQSDMESGDQIGQLSRLHLDLGEALSDFTIAHGKALKTLYKNYPNTMGEGDEMPSVSSGPNEGIFAIYFFLFNLEEFAKELLHLIDLFISIREEEESLDRRRMVLDSKYGKRLGWLVYSLDIGNAGRMPSRRPRTQRFKTLYDRLTTLVPKSLSNKELFPDVSAKAETSQMTVPKAISWPGKIQFALWRFSLKLKKKNVKFAIKTGVGAALLGLPAFLPSTRPTWVALRMEWGMISYQVVIAATTAQSNFNAFFRTAGTIAGALVAILVYHAARENPFILILAGFLFSLPNFWLIVTKPKYATTGRFILLAYNLTALYAFNKREEDLHVSLIAFKRTIAVVIGTTWAWLVSVSVWPYEARRELRVELATLLLNCAFLYEKLVRAYSTPPVSLQQPVALTYGTDNTNPNERTSLLTADGRGELKRSVDEFAAMELYLQRGLISLHGLLDQTALEPRLKGPFPTETYKKLLLTVQAILDQLHSMRCVTTREEWYFDVRRDFILPVQNYRREMVGNVLLYFSLLASCLSLKIPMPAYLPPASQARQRLVEAIRELDVVKRKSVKNSTSFLLYYAYAVTIKDLIDQLDACGELMKDLFGVLGQDFEALFQG